jgi:hypothetical protein
MRTVSTEAGGHILVHRGAVEGEERGKMGSKVCAYV